MKIKIGAGVISLVVLVIVIGAKFTSSKANLMLASSPEYQQILDELMSVENISRSPVPGSSGETLASVRNTEIGRGIYLVDLKTLRQTPLNLTNEVERVSGWSPDSRYLFFNQSPPMSDSTLKETSSRRLPVDRKQAWLTFYDLEKDSLRRLTTNAVVNESSMVWLTQSNFLFCVDSDDKAIRGIYRGSSPEMSARKVYRGLHELVPMSENKAAYIKAGNIFSMEVQAEGEMPLFEQLSEFQPKDYDLLRWLRYSRENATFLFCARPTNSIWRYLFQFDPRDKTVRQLSHEDTYNGQWIQGGTGFAYVGNSNNSFYLVIKTKDTAGWTNLFTKGSVASYTVASDGEKIYVVAAVGIEPQATWEYDVSARALRKVTEGTTKPLKVSRLSEPTEFRVKSFDGVEIPCFSFAPIKKSGNNTKVKHPVILYLPPQTAQMQRVFDSAAQMVVNLGFYFVAVNYRGCDGYGTDYSKMNNDTDAAKDVLAVYDHLIKSPEVDKKNIFLWTRSSGSQVAYHLLENKPKLWRGLVFIHPILGSPEHLPQNLPPIFFSSGEQDPALPAVKQFQEWALANAIEMGGPIYTNTPHLSFNSKDIKDTQDRASRFVLSHVK